MHHEPRNNFCEPNQTTGRRIKADAQYNLGHLHMAGPTGVKQNYAKAREWFERAAERAHPTAQFNLGLMRLYGHGVEQSFAE